MSAPTLLAGREDGTKERSRLIKLLHVGRRAIGMDDDSWREYLATSHGVQSSTQLHVGKLQQALDHLKKCGFKPEKSSSEHGEWSFADRATEEKRPLLRKIVATCRAMGKGRTYAEGVARRQTGVARRLEMMSYDELYKVAQALANTQRHNARKEGQP